MSKKILIDYSEWERKENTISELHAECEDWKSKFESLVNDGNYIFLTKEIFLPYMLERVHYDVIKKDEIEQCLLDELNELEETNRKLSESLKRIRERTWRILWYKIRAFFGYDFI